MKAKALLAIKKYKMLNDGDSVIAAVSGGADSMALLHLLLFGKIASNLKIEVCHINHMIRGAEADRDEAFVKEFCEKHNVPFHLLRADIPALSKQCGKSVEECGRDVRYNFFKSCAQKIGAKIATAHTLSDSIETFMLNVARGTGINGLCGIPPVRDNIIRPLIFCTREEIESYDSENQVDFVNDSTNFLPEYARNKIRLSVVPVLKEINSSAEKNFQRMIMQNSEDADFIEGIALEKYKNFCRNNKIDLTSLKSENQVIIKRVVMRFLSENNLSCDSRQLELILEYIRNGKGKIEIKNNSFIAVDENYLALETEYIKPDYFEIKLSEGKFKLNNEYKIKISLLSEDIYKKFKKNPQKVLKILIDYDKIIGMAVIRQRKDGDSIKLAGRGCTKSLKKLFNEAALSQSERDNIPVVCDNEGIIFVYGFGAAERVAADESTKRIIVIEQIKN